MNTNTEAAGQKRRKGTRANPRNITYRTKKLRWMVERKGRCGDRAGICTVQQDRGKGDVDVAQATNVLCRSSSLQQSPAALPPPSGPLPCTPTHTKPHMKQGCSRLPHTQARTLSHLEEAGMALPRRGQMLDGRSRKVWMLDRTDPPSRAPRNRLKTFLQGGEVMRGAGGQLSQRHASKAFGARLHVWDARCLAAFLFQEQLQSLSSRDPSLCWVCASFSWMEQAPPFPSTPAHQ